MKGLLRFERLEDGPYYAPMAPDHNILCLMAPHFASRLADQKWAIHDVRRGFAVLYDGVRWTVETAEEIERSALASEESLYQQLWKEYFKKAASPDRKNLQLQRQFMPRRYWRFLTEMTG